MADAAGETAAVEYVDPVCGMTVTPEDAAGHVDHRGTRYYFCNQGCLDRFRAAPDTFLGGGRGVVQAPQAGATYVCSMDPEVRQATPGPCPRCGMALEPDLAGPVMRVEYTCPMHPEIVRDQPGACPICGMALEPRVVALEDAPNPELADMTRRMWIAAVVGAPVF